VQFVVIIISPPEFWLQPVTVSGAALVITLRPARGHAWRHCIGIWRPATGTCTAPTAEASTKDGNRDTTWSAARRAAARRIEVNDTAAISGGAVGALVVVIKVARRIMAATTGAGAVAVRVERGQRDDTVRNGNARLGV